LYISVVPTVVRYDLYARTFAVVRIIQALELTQLDYALASRSLPVDDYDALAEVRINIQQRAMIGGRDVVDGIVGHRGMVVANLERYYAAGHKRQRRGYKKQLPGHLNTSYF
jgi:hypothetical protein